MGWETQPLPCAVARCGLTNPQHRGIIPCFLKQVLNIINHKADNQLTRFKFALRNTNLVSRRGILPRPRELTMLGIDKRESALYLEHTPHPVGRASRPATRQRIIGQTPKKALTYVLILQYVNRRGRSRAIVVLPDAQATIPPLISKLITGIINLLGTNDCLCPPVKDRELTILLYPGTHPTGGNPDPIFSKHSMNCTTT